MDNSKEKNKLEGFCEHGNLPATCALCSEMTPENFDQRELDRSINEIPMFVDFQRYVDDLRARYIEAYGLKPDAKNDEIMQAIDHHFLARLKDTAKTVPEGLIEEYENSTDTQTLSYEKRQEMLNTILNPTNKIYKNRNGEDISLRQYLKDYYKPLGIEVTIRFDCIPPNLKNNLLTKLRKLDPDSKPDFDYITSDKQPIPFLIVKKGDQEITTPILGGDLDSTVPLRRTDFNPETGEVTRRVAGEFICVKMIHSTEYGSTLQFNVGSLVHEIDHAIRRTFPNQEFSKLEHRLVSEGSAERARIMFAEVQNRYRPNSGDDFSATLNFALAALGEGKTENHPYNKELEATYATGYILSEGFTRVYGEDKFFAMAYDATSAFGPEELKKIRTRIREKLDANKKIYRDFLVK